MNYLRLLELLHDPTTGVFTWRGRVGRCSHAKSAAGAVAGTVGTKGYRCIKLDGKSYKAHRLAWLYVHGEWPTDQIYHRDTDTSNNAIANLRQATLAENAQNKRRPYRNNASNYLGVSWYTEQEKWSATIHTGGKNKRLGRFATPEEAHAAYAAAKATYHPFSTGTA